MTEPAGRRAFRPLLFTLLGVLWIGLTFATCSSFHVDGIPGVHGFDPERNGVLVLYFLVSIRGVSSQEATLVIYGLMMLGAVMVLAGITMAVRRARKR